MSKIIVYQPPTFEHVQHEVTHIESVNNCDVKYTSLHSDISLLQRIDRIHASNAELQSLKDHFDNVLPNNPLGEVLSKMSDDELLKSCDEPRWKQTLSEQQSYVKSLADERKKELEAEKAKAKEDEEKAKAEKEERDWNELVKRFNSI